MGLGIRELAIILLVVLVVFGTKKLRTIGSDLGGAVRNFRKAMREGSEPARPAGLARIAEPDAEFPETLAAKAAASRDRAA